MLLTPLLPNGILLVGNSTRLSRCLTSGYLLNPFMLSYFACSFATFNYFASLGTWFQTPSSLMLLQSCFEVTRLLPHY